MKNLIVLILILSGGILSAQDTYFTRNATVTFFSSTPVEDIRAENFNATAVLDKVKGAIEFSVLMKSFNFKKALMQEHFNENYVESDQFPKATFKGRITNLEEVDFSTPGKYPATVSGEMTIHGVTKEIEADGFLEVSKDGIICTSVFKVSPEDYGIEIPGVVRDKIAKEIEVTVQADLEPLKK